MGRGKFDPDEYVQWLERIPQENRMQIAELLASEPVASYDDLVLFSQRVMTHVLAGDIAPVAAEAAVKWAEIMLTSLAARENAAVGKQDSYVELIDALTSVQDDEVEATYTTGDVLYAEAVNE
jgi:hypothetical protein